MSPNHVATDARSNELTAVVLGLLLSAFLILGVGFADSSCSQSTVQLRTLVAANSL